MDNLRYIAMNSGEALLLKDLPPAEKGILLPGVRSFFADGAGRRILPIPVPLKPGFSYTILPATGGGGGARVTIVENDSKQPVFRGIICWSNPRLAQDLFSWLNMQHFRAMAADSEGITYRGSFAMTDPETLPIVIGLSLPALARTEGVVGARMEWTHVFLQKLCHAVMDVANKAKSS